MKTSFSKTAKEITAQGHLIFYSLFLLWLIPPKRFLMALYLALMDYVIRKKKNKETKSPI